MPAYIVATVRIHDRETYRRYEAGFLDTFTPFGGRVLAVEEDAEVVEGRWPATRTVILEFENRERDRAWYASEPYQTLAQHRFRAAQSDLVLLRGLPAS